MGFFAQHGGFAEAPTWSVAPTGTYKCRLVSMDCVDRPSFDDPTRLEPNYKWVWETTEVGDEDGKPYSFIMYTKTYYGNDQSKLTRLLDTMVGKRMTKAEFNGLDLDVLMAKDWMVDVTLGINGKGRETNAIQVVRPFAKPLAPKRPLPKPQAAEDIQDPFAE